MRIYKRTVADIDVVFIATPHFAHYGNIKYAQTRSKYFLSESGDALFEEGGTLEAFSDILMQLVRLRWRLGVKTEGCLVVPGTKG